MNINLSLFGQAITFAIFVWFTMKYVWPPIMGAMEERETKISDGLAAGRRGEELLAKAQQEAAEVLSETKDKAAAILEQANLRATHLIEDAKNTAKQEGERLLTAARAEIGQETLQAREALRAEVAKIALLGAEKVLARSVSDSDHEEFLTKLVANL